VNTYFSCERKWASRSRKCRGALYHLVIASTRGNTKILIKRSKGGTDAHDGKTLMPVSQKEVISTKSLSHLTNVAATRLGGVCRGGFVTYERAADCVTCLRGSRASTCHYTVRKYMLSSDVEGTMVRE
jgi:hypothetical protein